MKILIISGSRNPEGQTARAGKALGDGAASEGAEIEHVFLPQKNINCCRQCDGNGWGTCISEAHCQLPDDFGEIIGRLKKADAVAFTTPVYYGDLSESMRSFLDRLRRLTTGESGRNAFRAKPAIGICVAGGGGGGSFNCCRRMEEMLGVPGFDLVDMVPVRRQNLALKESILHLTGKWFAAALMAGEGERP